MHPVVMSGRLLAVLAHAHIAERWLAGHRGALHHDGQAAGVHDDLAGGAFHPGSVFLRVSWCLRKRREMDYNVEATVTVLRWVGVLWNNRAAECMRAKRQTRARVAKLHLVLSRMS